MNCTEFEILASDYVDGMLPGAELEAFEAHRASCAHCQEFLRDVTEAVTFLERVDQIEVPQELVTRIVYHAPAGKFRDSRETPGFLNKIYSTWLQPVLQPKLAMGMAMTILSFAMLSRCTGIQVQQLKPSDLNPVKVWTNLEDRGQRMWDRTVKYYDNLKVVYEIRSQIHDLTGQEDVNRAPAQNDARNSSGSGKSGTDKTGGTQ